jgi:hypothetical protein
MRASVFDTSVGELERGHSVSLKSASPGSHSGVVAYLQSRKLDIRVLVSYALLERAHRLLGLNSLGANNIGNLEILSYVFPVARVSIATS